MMRLVALLFFLATILATCNGSDHGQNFHIFPLQMKTGLGGHDTPEMSCSSWRLGVEAHNIIDWETVPEQCGDYVKNYILGNQYREDSRAVTQEAYLYANKSLNLNGDGKDNIWVFDIDETVLSNVPFYAQYGYGVKRPSDPEAFVKWAKRGVAQKLQDSFELYKNLSALGIKIVFLSGRPENLRDITKKNLKDQGYDTYAKLILIDYSKDQDKGVGALKASERKKLEEEGFTIVGNMGDQWSDILGSNPGSRTFKLPNPMYYVH